LVGKGTYQIHPRSRLNWLQIKEMRDRRRDEKPDPSERILDPGGGESRRTRSRKQEEGRRKTQPSSFLLLPSSLI
jgi:hypothetical protein